MMVFFSQAADRGAQAVITQAIAVEAAVLAVVSAVEAAVLAAEGLPAAGKIIWKRS